MVKRSASTYLFNGYVVRESTRAKRVSIRVAKTAEVEIVVPRGCPKARIAELINAKQDWIERTVQKIEMERRSRPQESQDERPSKIVLRSLPEEWTVQYQAESTKSVRLTTTGPQQLLISGDIGHIPTCHYVLQKWVRRKAQQHLPQWLRAASQEVQLSYKKVTIRRQKTLWASCSNKTNISLNDKLLFLPFPIVRYVLIHELCHTIHMNHSTDFWHVVEQKEPNYRELDTDLNDAWHYVPDWLTASS